jgi:peroxiredoxin
MKLFFCLSLIICVSNIYAQVSLLQNAVNKIESSSNLSFQEKDTVKNSYNPDTLTLDKKVVVVQQPKDAVFGYFFKVNSGQTSAVYSGQNAVTYLNFKDSSYTFMDPKVYAIFLLDYIKQLKQKINDAQLVEQTRDTLLNAIPCYHFIEIDQDSNSNTSGSYAYKDWFIDRQNGNIVRSVDKWRATDAGGNVLFNFMQSDYADFKFNDGNLEISFPEIPSNFHLKNQENKPLEVGSIAPAWTLYSTDGNSLSFYELKGKVVLIDFSYIGCLPCMQAIGPMNRLHEKYKDKAVKIVSIYPLDKTAAVKKYVEKYGIKYPVYMDANTLPAKYHVTGYPGFYLIDQDGKVANVISGYSDSFEQEISSTIDQLLK